MSQYLSGIYALNLRSPDGTHGDWHYPVVNWQNIKFRNTEDSVFGDWALYEGEIPEYGNMQIASHVRACLDLLTDGCFETIEGMRKNFICEERYTQTIFDKVWLLRNNDNWAAIDTFMGKEYLCDWLKYKEMKNNR